MNYSISKETLPSGKRHYIVKDETGREVGNRISFSNYVACLVLETPATSRVLPCWFTRRDRIGEGHSWQQYRRLNVKVASV